MDNQSVRAGSLRQSQPVGYSIVFSPDKPQASVPKCVQNYRSKPAASPGSLQKKLEEAAERRKENEQARLTRIQRTDETLKQFDQRLRPYLDALAMEFSSQY